MKHIFRGLLVATGAVVLAVGVLKAVEILLSDPKRSRRSQPLDVETKPEAVPIAAEVPPVTPERKFSIKRTKSEVGFVYWILEGYGRYKCFLLCDTWDEAMAQARARVEELDGVLADSKW